VDTAIATQILHLDDNSADALLFHEAVERFAWPAAIHHAAMPSQATLFLNRLGDYATAPVPDLVVVDLHLRASDGRQFIEMLAGHIDFKDLRVAVLSGTVTRSDRARCRSLGIPCFEKPMTIDGYEPIVAALRKLAKR
jgi:two-component system, chemotaxis family, response regulator Rcp1